LHENGEDFSFPNLEVRLTEHMQKLLSAIFFADSNGEVFSREQAAAYVRVLDSEDRKLQAESLRARLKQAERSGDIPEAFRLEEELSRLQRSRNA